MPLYRQAKSPYWWVRIQVAGTKIRKSSGTADRAAAEEFEQLERDRLWRLEKLGDRSATPFSEAAKRWLLETSKKSKKKDEIILAWFNSQPELKDAPLSEIDIEAIQLLRTILAIEGRKPATVDRYMCLLRAILRKCEFEWRLIDHAPKVPMHNARRPERVWLTRPQFDKLKKELPEHLALAAQFAVLTMLRMRAMLSLTWDKVDLRTRRAWIASGDMKGGLSHGIPLSREAVKVLRKLKTLSPEGNHVFQYDKKPIDDCNTAAFQKAVKRAGIPKINWHSLRHTSASWAVQSGVSLHELMQLGGWKSYSMVLVYAHLAPDQLASAAEKVSGKRHTEKRPMAK